MKKYKNIQKVIIKRNVHGKGVKKNNKTNVSSESGDERKQDI